ncbi:MAG: hypothetical protein HPY54_14185 [Chthonomonadetes bacterium]|nr:hypothetical protein [Chthonomonadetes bacterium]
MRAFGMILLLVRTLLLPAWADGDAFDRTLSQVGLSKETARFNPLDLQLYGGGDYRLPFFDSLHLDPWRVPFVASVVRRDCLQNAENAAALLSAASLRLSEGTRRTLIADPTEPLKRKASEMKQPLRQAIEAVYQSAGQSLPPRASWLTQLNTVPEAMQKPVAYLLLAMIEARRWRDLAFRDAFAHDAPSSLYEMLCQPLSRAEGMQDRFNTPYWCLMRNTDLKALFAGAHDLLLAAESVAKELQKASIPDGFRVDIPTPYGTVALHDGRADTFTRQKYLLIVDTGGDDTYLGTGGTISAEHSITVIIDLKGNDRYLQDAPMASRAIKDVPDRKTRRAAPCIGGAVLGYAFVLDMDGNDLYRSLSLSQGGASFGVGVLVDAGGDDRYECYTAGQGSADWGGGLLVDRAGDDRYHGFSNVQGYGGTKGYGLLLDVQGDDSYLADDTNIDFPSPQTEAHNVSMAQGAGYGRRADYTDGHSLAGGIGILVDGAGNDRYICGVFGQGVGYWYGLGLLCDGGGDDVYQGVWYVQGASAHFAVGVLEDVSGNDQYTATMNMAQGAGHDFSLGWLIELGGNDTYRAPNLSLGGGNANGIGIFWDSSGDDRYIVSPSITLGRSNIGARGSLRERALCLGLFCDTGGKDTYPEGFPFARDNALWTQPGASQPPMPREYGVGIDCEDAPVPENL